MMEEGCFRVVHVIKDAGDVPGVLCQRNQMFEGIPVIDHHPILEEVDVQVALGNTDPFTVVLSGLSGYEAICRLMQSPG